MSAMFFLARLRAFVLQCSSNAVGRTARPLLVGLAIFGVGSIPQQTFADDGTITVTADTCPTNEIQIWSGDTLVGCSDGTPSFETGAGSGGAMPGGQGPVGSVSIPSLATIEHASDCVVANGGQPARMKESFSDVFAFLRSNGSVYSKSTDVPNSPSDVPVLGSTTSSTVYYAGSYQSGWAYYGYDTANPGQILLTGFEQLMWTMAHERIHQYGNVNQPDDAGGYYDTEAYKVIKSYESHGNGSNCPK